MFVIKIHNQQYPSDQITRSMKRQRDTKITGQCFSQLGFRLQLLLLFYSNLLCSNSSITIHSSLIGSRIRKKDKIRRINNQNHTASKPHYSHNQTNKAVKNTNVRTSFKKKNVQDPYSEKSRRSYF